MVNWLYINENLHVVYIYILQWYTYTCTKNVYWLLLFIKGPESFVYISRSLWFFSKHSLQSYYIIATFIKYRSWISVLIILIDIFALKTLYNKPVQCDKKLLSSFNRCVEWPNSINIRMIKKLTLKASAQSFWFKVLKVWNKYFKGQKL